MVVWLAATAMMAGLRCGVGQAGTMPATRLFIPGVTQEDANGDVVKQGAFVETIHAREIESCAVPREELPSDLEMFTGHDVRTGEQYANDPSPMWTHCTGGEGYAG